MAYLTSVYFISNVWSRFGQKQSRGITNTAYKEYYSVWLDIVRMPRICWNVMLKSESGCMNIHSCKPPGVGSECVPGLQVLWWITCALLHRRLSGTSAQVQDTIPGNELVPTPSAARQPNWQPSWCCVPINFFTYGFGAAYTNYTN